MYPIWKMNISDTLALFIISLIWRATVANGTLPGHKYIGCFGRADNDKMRAANESYALKVNIIFILFHMDSKNFSFLSSFLFFSFLCLSFLVFACLCLSFLFFACLFFVIPDVMVRISVDGRVFRGCLESYNLEDVTTCAFLQNQSRNRYHQWAVKTCPLRKASCH